MLGDALLTPHPSICGSRTRIEPPAGTSPVAMNEISADVLTPGVSSVELNELRPENDPDLIAAVDEDEVTDNDDFQEATGVICRPFNRGVRCLI